ncbi:hypothetical protein [Nonomuraea jiangxiensis]|uniref:hypothetical protein n=1 Tax=Nonomuraea jiangxiensis TaxID=633440 RepID=UPI00115FEB29|nr:hypothetical protein [Nonomuraea jiangxiensis]
MVKRDLSKELTHTYQEVSQQITDLKDDVSRLGAEFRAGARLTDLRYERDRLESRMRRTFGPRQTVRRIAVGLVGELTAASIRAQVIDEDTLHRFASEQAIVNTDYWLASALRAVAAEYTGADRLRDRALSLAQAYAEMQGQDPAKTDLFMALVCSQLAGSGSDKAADYWSRAATHMNLYLDKVDSFALDRGFFSVLDALAEQELGDEARSYASEALARWVRDREPTSAINQQQLHISRDYLLRHALPFPGSDYATLQEMSHEHWDNVREGWRCASACQGAAMYLSERFRRPLEARPNGRSHARRALRTLIETLEPDELELQREIYALEQAISRKDGKVTGSEDPYAETVDFATLLTLAAFNPAESGIGPQAQQFALACARNWILMAGREVTAEALRIRPIQHPLRLGNWNNTLEIENPRSGGRELVAQDRCEHVARMNPVQRRYRLGLAAITAFVAVLALVLVGDVRLVLGVLALGAVLAVIEHFNAKNLMIVREQRVTAAQEIARKQIDDCDRQGRSLLRKWTLTANAGIEALDKALTDLSMERR